MHTFHNRWQISLRQVSQELAAEFQEERAMQWLGQKVSYHQCSSQMTQLNLTSFNEMMNEEVPNFNMSRSLTC